MKRRDLRAIIAILLGPGLVSAWVASGALPVDPATAIQEVQADERDEARASWWGFCAEDSTAVLQAAIDAGARRVIVEAMEGPWIVEPLRLASRQELVFEPGVVVQAKAGSFHGGGDSLFTARAARDITLTGYGATLAMRRGDYASSGYTKAEWRHVISLRGCTDVFIRGLTLAESGGDGIYLGAGPRGEPNVNVQIRDVVCERNYRQAISVITAENLLIEDCVLRGTAGTPPGAGIDFEPNRPSERLVNCVLRRCLSEDNEGQGYLFALHLMDGTSAPVSIRLEECVSRGSNVGSVRLHAANAPAGGAVRGRLELVRCSFEDRGTAGIDIGSNPAAGLQLSLVDCRLADPAPHPTRATPILFRSRPGDSVPIGGVEFDRFVLAEQVERPIMEYHDWTGAGIQAVRGTLTVQLGEVERPIVLDPPTLARLLPTAALKPIPRVPTQRLELVPVSPRASVAEWTPAPHRLRQTAAWVVYAEVGETVSLRFEHLPVGGRSAEPMPIRVLAPDGEEVHCAAAPLGEKTQVRFTAPETGAYRIDCRPGPNVVQLVRSSHPACIDGGAGPVHLMSTAAELWFWVPPGTGEFAVRTSGESEGERVRVTLFDPAGTRVWEEESVAMTREFVGSATAPDLSGAWRLRCDRPAEGVLEDFSIDLRGIPPLLAYHPEALLRADWPGRWPAPPIGGRASGSPAWLIENAASGMKLILLPSGKSARTVAPDSER